MIQPIIIIRGTKCTIITMIILGPWFWRVGVGERIRGEMSVKHDILLSLSLYTSSNDRHDVNDFR